MRSIPTIICIVLLALAATASAWSDFATEVVSFNGPPGPSPYDDPNTALAKPSTEVFDPGFPPMVPSATFAPSLVYAAWNTDTQGNKLLVSLPEGAQVVVKFDHQVVDHPGNWYGQDFIVYGNAFFEGSGNVSADTNMAQHYLTHGGVNAEPLTVSVSSDGAKWFTFGSGPYADGYFPTNPFTWDRGNGQWGQELDWTKPVDPALTPSNFAGKSVADAIDLYGYSAGGTSFDLHDLAPGDYSQLDAVQVDLGNGWMRPCKYIRYVKVACNGEETGELDGLSDVAVDPSYDPGPRPGDLNDDDFVGQTDLDIVLSYWGQNVKAGDWLMGDPSGDGFVGQTDLDWVLANWGQGTWPSAGMMHVPEPATGALLSVWVAAMALGPRGGHRRRKSQNI